MKKKMVAVSLIFCLGIGMFCLFTSISSAAETVAWADIFESQTAVPLTSIADTTSTVTSAIGGVIQLPQTGQTKCYDTNGNVIACAGTGQDGETRMGVAWPNPRFKIIYCDASTNPPCADQSNDCDGNALNDVVMDNLTGLMWLRSGNMPGTGLNWSQSVEFANNLTLCGYSDWSLPNVNELNSILNAEEEFQNLWLEGQGFVNVLAAHYWTGTLSQSGDAAWTINLVVYETAWIFNNVTESYYVWPVRSGGTGIVSLPKTGQTTSLVAGDDGNLQRGIAWPDPRFEDNDDGTVTDKLTSLIWLKDANCISTHYPFIDTDNVLNDGRVTWQHALEFVKGIDQGLYSNCGAGFTGWRLPNSRELQSLVDYSNVAPIVTGPFNNVSTFVYHSSTTDAAAKTFEDAVHFFFGMAIYTHKSVDCSVWPVRGGQGGLGSNFVLSVSKTGTGTGTVTPDSGSITWNGNNGTATYSQGTQVLLTAPPAIGSYFAGWSGCDTSNGNQCTVTMNAVQNVTATFTLNPTQQYSLAIAKLGTGNGAVTSSPAGINCGDDCSETYDQGTVITLTAVASNSSTFDGWSGGGCSGTGTCVTTLNADTNITASFATSASLPDLTGTWTSLSRKCKNIIFSKICEIKGTFTIQNTGNQDSTSTDLYFYLSDDSSIGVGDKFLKRMTTGGIPAGGSRSKTVKMKLPSGKKASGKYIFGLIDLRNTVAESNENNNNIFFGPLP